MNNELYYERLKRITEIVKPYRGTTDKFPFSDRNHNYKYFYPKEVNGEIEFHVGYWHQWESETATAEEYNAKKDSMTKRELNQWREERNWDHNNRTHTSTGNYIKDSKKPKVDLIIRSDDTVEFVMDNFHQGMRQIYSGWSRHNYGIFQSSVNHGGVIYVVQDKTIPVFKGLRINYKTLELHPSSKYQATYSKVNRAKSKEAMEKYQDKLNMAFSFMKCMEPKDFKDDKDSVTTELMGMDNYYWGREAKEKAIMLADSLIFDKPVEAIYLYMKAFGVGYYLSSLAHASDWVNAFKKKYAKYIQEKHDTFDKETITYLEPFKSSTWNIDITVNGKMVERLK